MQPRAALFLAGLAAGCLVANFAFAKADDPAEVKKLREEVRKELKDEKQFPFYDLSYVVNVPKLKDSRWSQKDPPPGDKPTEEEGLQLYSTWAVNSSEGGWGIEVAVFKMIHTKTEGGKKSKFHLKFDHIGGQADTSDAKKILEMSYLDWKKASSDVVEKECVDLKKSSAGPADFFASATATDAETKKRERRDWYVWRSPNVTWLARVRFDQSILDQKNDELLDKGEDFVKQIDEIKDKRLK